MKMENYEKPELKFVSLQNEERVANTCWGHHKKGTTLYCDIPGAGYCSFQISAGSCSLELIEVQYYSDTNKDGEITSNEAVPATQDQINTLTQILASSGGSDGTNFKGEGTVVVEKPGNWS